MSLSISKFPVKSTLNIKYETNIVIFHLKTAIVIVTRPSP